MSPKSNDIVVFTNAKTKNSELYYADLIITVSGPLLGNFVGLSKSYTESIFATIILEGIYDLGSKIFAKIFAKILLNFQFRVDLKKKKSGRVQWIWYPRPDFSFERRLLWYGDTTNNDCIRHQCINNNQTKSNLHVTNLPQDLDLVFRSFFVVRCCSGFISSYVT